jgi:rhodanese-related sulfurtransferase
VEEFVQIMANLNLSQPKKIDIAVPANRNCGLPIEESSRGWAPILRSSDGVPEVTAAWVADRSENLRVVDVREPAEFNGALGHIDGAQLVPLATVAEAASDWDPATPTLVVCRSGGRSGKAALSLESLGFIRVVSMTGGMQIWNDSNLPIQR